MQQQYYVKVPMQLLDESQSVVWHYCKIYRDVLQGRKLNLSKYARQHHVSYTTIRRLHKLAKQMSRK